MREPSTTWRESIPEGEDALFQRLAQELSTFQRAAAGEARVDRALHTKQHAGLRARLEVVSGLSPSLAQGLFARPGSHDAYVRLSNGGARLQHDAEPDLRGFAVKVLGVEGDKVLSSNAAGAGTGDPATQDLLFIDEDALPFTSPSEFVAFLRSARRPATLPFALVGALGLRAFGLLAALAKTVKGKRGSLLDLSYHSVAPIAWGPHAARLHLEPQHARSPHARVQREPDYLRRELGPRVHAGGIAYAIVVQLLTDEGDSVEDGTRSWSSPRARVGTLTLLSDDPTSERGVALDAFVAGLSFDPWHALVAHRPLGATMRARKHAYYASTVARGAAPEPDGQEWSSFAS